MVFPPIGVAQRDSRAFIFSFSGDGSFRCNSEACEKRKACAAILALAGNVHRYLVQVRVPGKLLIPDEYPEVFRELIVWDFDGVSGL